MSLSAANGKEGRIERLTRRSGGGGLLRYIVGRFPSLGHERLVVLQEFGSVKGSRNLRDVSRDVFPPLSCKAIQCF
jgi:hypothetical protein